MASMTLAEAKTHLNVDFTDDDVYIATLIELVDECVLDEIQGKFTGEGTVSTTVAVAVVGIDTNFLDYSVGDTITVKDATLGTEVSRVIDTITSDTALTVTLAFAAVASGLTYNITTALPSPLPKRLLQAAKLLLAYFYMVREPVVLGVSAVEVPFGFKYLIHFWKNWTIA